MRSKKELVVIIIKIAFAIVVCISGWNKAYAIGDTVYLSWLGVIEYLGGMLMAVDGIVTILSELFGVPKEKLLSMKEEP